MNKAAIFDLDGTLLDSLEDIAFCANTALEISGLPRHETEEFRNFVGWGSGQLIKKMMGDTDFILHGEKVRADYMMIYSDLCAREGRSYPGILPMLERLREAGIKTGVVTNKPHAMAQLVHLSTYGERLDLTLGQMEGAAPKPDPTGLLRALAELSVSPEDAVFVGDSEVDILTGKNARVFTIAVTWGFKTKEFLKSFDPDLMVDTVEELEKNILQRLDISLAVV